MPLQPDWRFCNKCNAMFLDGFPGKGQCPGGGGHQAQGFNVNIQVPRPIGGVARTSGEAA